MSSNDEKNVSPLLRDLKTTALAKYWCIVRSHHLLRLASKNLLIWSHEIIFQTNYNVSLLLWILWLLNVTRWWLVRTSHLPQCSNKTIITWRIKTITSVIPGSVWTPTIDFKWLWKMLSFSPEKLFSGLKISISFALKFKALSII